MRRWIVGPSSREVRAVSGSVTALRMAVLSADEFLFDAPTAADAAMAGRRHNLAVEALESIGDERWVGYFGVVRDRIEWNVGAGTATALEAISAMATALEERGFEVWREGLALLVLGRRVKGTEGIHAWVSEIGSDR